MNRRHFLISAAGLPAFAANFLVPQNASAGVVTALAFLLEGNPLMLIAALMEWAYDYNGETQRKATTDQSLSQLDSISSQIAKIAQNQSAIIKALDEQRTVMKQVFQEALFEDDVRKFTGLIQEFQLALGTSSSFRTRKLTSVWDRLDDLAWKIPQYGPAGASAYIAAIALHNSVYYAVDALPSDFRAMNGLHQKNLARMLNGKPDDPATLPYLITHEPNGKMNPAFEFGKRYGLGIVSRNLGSNEWLSFVYGLEFVGYKQGAPAFRAFTDSLVPHSFRGVRGRVGRSDSSEIWFGAIQSADHATVPGLVMTEDGQAHVEPVTFNGDRFTLSPQAESIVSRQRDVLANYLRQFYDGHSGDFDASSPIRPWSAQQQELSSFIQTGADQVARIIRVHSGGTPVPGLLKPVYPTIFR